MELCKKCLEHSEPPVDPHIAIPQGVCPVCFIRYGRYIPICRKGSEL